MYNTFTQDNNASGCCFRRKRRRVRYLATKHDGISEICILRDLHRLCDHSRATTAPMASNVFCIFSASSFERLAFNVCGSDSTNFFACITKNEESIRADIHNLVSYLHKRQGRVHGLHLSDDLRLGGCVEGRELDVENGLRLWFLLKLSHQMQTINLVEQFRSTITHLNSLFGGSCSRSSCWRRGRHSDFLDVQPRLQTRENETNPSD